MPAAGNRGTGVGRFGRVKGGISTIGKGTYDEVWGMEIRIWVSGRRGGIILNGWDGKGVSIPLIWRIEDGLDGW